MFEPVRRRLTLLYTGTFLLLLLAILGTLYFSTEHLLSRMESRQLESIADRELFERIEHGENTSGADTIYFEIRNPEGRILFSSLPDFAESEALDRFARSDDAFTEQEWSGRNILLHKRESDDRTVLLLKNVTPTKETLNQLILLLVAIAIVATVLLTAIGYFLAGRTVRPIQAAFERQRQFTSDASHELRTPLTIVYSGIELLETEPLTEEGRLVLKDVKSETETMQSLISDLLLIAREGQSTRMTRISLSESVLRAAERFRHVLPAGHHLELSIEPSIHIMGDDQQIGRLVHVFLENAVQYSDGGVIHISLTDEEGPSLRVTDTGIGIDEKDTPRLFDRFYRGDHARHGSGSGLGLAIAKTIANNHGATIGVESVHGQGTTFTVRFPDAPVS
ncbi:sensor histidine kinase [Exiguobacterium flavidum]|uniref:sensor histidine kinase n=1 Tax=Exiguobacterium flavidum TaxID=2184695 RepID=UPI000DF868D5|nr:HAMP domain-containing sensor histidine kinase [Exiguobacterium flavidum]